MRYRISAVIDSDGGPKDALAKLLDLRSESQQFTVAAFDQERVIDAEGPTVRDMADVTDALPV